MGVIKPIGIVPMDVLDIHITPTGFRLRFTHPLDPAAADHSQWAIKRYTYKYHSAYGSPQVDLAEVPVTEVRLSKDRLTAEVVLPEVKENFVHEFTLGKLLSATGDKLLNPKLAYTVRRVPRG
jgi:hypothetical protein